MEWIDERIVLGVKRHGESSIILELMTRTHGRHLGLVRGGSGPRMRGILQAAAWEVREVFTGPEQPMRLWLCEPRSR